METIRRACGHDATFTPKGDRHDDARREKLRNKRCHACGLAKNLADNAAQTGRVVKKGQEVKLLPAHTAVTLTRTTEGGWVGTITVGPKVIKITGNGVMGLVNKLARLALREGGAKLQGKVTES